MQPAHISPTPGPFATKVFNINTHTHKHTHTHVFTYVCVCFVCVCVCVCVCVYHRTCSFYLGTGVHVLVAKLNPKLNLLFVPWYKYRCASCPLLTTNRSNVTLTSADTTACDPRTGALYKMNKQSRAMISRHTCLRYANSFIKEYI